MELTLSHEPGYVLAKTIGPIDDTASDLFGDLLHPLVGQTGTRLVVDLSGSPRINSNGLSQLVKLVCDANSRGSRVAFAAPTAFVASVLNVTRLDKFLAVVPEVSQAISSICDGPAS